MMAFRNPANGYVEQVRHPGLWTLLFGPVYFLVRGVWVHAILALLLIGPTVFLSWLIYPFFARSILRTHYLRRGWVETTNILPHD